MKVIIAGSRTLGTDTTDVTLISNAVLCSPFHPTEIVCGGAKGIDTLGAIWGSKYRKAVRYFRPDWDKHGKKAGILRNIKMGNYADALIAIWNGSSPGTKHMINYMKSLKKPVYLYNTDEHSDKENKNSLRTAK